MRIGAAAIASVTFLGACSAVLDFDSRSSQDAAAPSSSSGGASSSGSSGASGGTPDSSGSGSDAATDGPTSDAPSNACPGSGGPTPVRIGASCIDSTEVTNAQYAAFLAAVGNTPAQSAPCTGNTSFVPAAGWPAASGTASVVEIDWCDAFAFCAWAQKKLCTGSTWKAACTGAFAGVVDMGGGRAEWVDDCTGDSCPVLGGGAAGCSASIGEPRLSPHEDVGFRCCSP